MKRYTEDELMTMKEEEVMRLSEDGKMDDDDAQRWYDLQEEMAAAVEAFLKYEYPNIKGDI